MSTSNLDFLAQLESIIRERQRSPLQGSYTTSLFNGGSKRIAQKVGEESVELALATVAGDRNETIDEAADLLYHVLVLLTDQGISLDDVVTTLEQRHSS